MHRLRLGVNIDHVATLRQARGTAYPDVLQAARACVRAGGQGITAHLREDRRHIQEADIRVLRKRLSVPLNMEMANVPEIVRIALDVRPQEVCLVPERRRELTTEGGLDVAGQKRALGATVRALAARNVAVSLFVDPEFRQLEAAWELGVPYVELHTGGYCAAPPRAAARELRRLIEGARFAHALGLRVNAGHGITMENLPGILRIPCLDTLNIGHSIVCDAVFRGLAGAVRAMRSAMNCYRGGEA